MTKTDEAKTRKELPANGESPGAGDVSFALDLARIREAEKALKHHREMLQRIIDTIPVMITIYDPNLKTFRFNNEFRRVLGWSEEEMAVDDPMALFYPDPRYREKVRQYMQSLEPGWRDFRVTAKDGTEVESSWANILLSDDTQIGIGIDIRRRKSSEEALRASEARYRSLFERMSEGFALHELIFDEEGRPCDYRFLEVNPAFERLTGLRAADVLGRTVREVLPDTEPAWIERYGEVVCTGEPARFEEYSRALGRWFEVYAHRTEPGRFAVVFLDSSERREAEERLRASLREKEVLLKEIHHRVKNNLQVISSLLNLQAEGVADPALHELFRDARDRVRSMALVHEKLYQSTDLAHVDFAAYARELLRYIWHANGSGRANVRLVFDMQPVLLSVEDAVPCGLILNELAANALKHAFPGRTDGEITVALSAGENGEVFMRLRDNGIGLPAGMDWRSPRSLGLRLVQMLTGQLNGTMEVRTNGGTDFQIVLKEPADGDRS